MPAPRPVFTKGQEVVLFSCWDRKGTYQIQRATVHSCGRRQMVLMSRDGSACFGRHFLPTYDQVSDGVGNFVWPVDLTDEQAETVAREFGAAYLVQERASLERCLRNPEASTGYLQAIRQAIAELHEPRARWGSR